MKHFSELCKSTLLSCTLDSSLPWLLRCYEMWHELFGCHLNYLYTPLLVVKIGLLCSAVQQILYSLSVKVSFMRMEQRSVWMWKQQTSCFYYLLFHSFKEFFFFFLRHGCMSCPITVISLIHWFLYRLPMKTTAEQNCFCPCLRVCVSYEPIDWFKWSQIGWTSTSN